MTAPTKVPPCPTCHASMAARVRPYHLRGIFLADVEVWECATCGTEFHSAETSRILEAEAKKKGLFGIEKTGISHPVPNGKPAKVHV